MPQCCYLAKGAKRPSHTTNTIKFDRIPFDPCNSIKRFDLSPFDQKNSTYLQPPQERPCKPSRSTLLPQWHVCATQMLAPRLPVTWLNTIWLKFFVESFGLEILSQETTKLSQLLSNSRNIYVNSRKYHTVGHMRWMHARPHRRKDQLPLRSLRDLRSR